MTLLTHLALTLNELMRRVVRALTLLYTQLMNYVRSRLVRSSTTVLEVGNFFPESRTEKLYDQVVEGGVVIIDDYGSFKGCRRATEEFFAMRRIKTHLLYVENSTLCFVKPATIFS
jgi:hypothetical protein